MSPIETLRQVKRAIRQPYAWPGGYPLYVVMADGEARAWMLRYVSKEDAGGWRHVEVLDTRDDCAETLWRWEA